MSGIEAGRQAPLWTVAELAAFLRINAKTVYEWVGRGQVPCVRLGRAVRFVPGEIIRWVEARKES